VCCSFAVVRQLDMAKKTLLGLNFLADPPYCANTTCTQIASVGFSGFNGMDIWHPVSKGSKRHLCHRFHQNKQSPLHTFTTFPRCYVKQRTTPLQLHPPQVLPLPTFLNLHGASFCQRAPQLLILLPFWLRHLHLQGSARVTTAACFTAACYSYGRLTFGGAAPPARPVRSAPGSTMSTPISTMSAAGSTMCAPISIMSAPIAQWVHLSTH